MQESNFIHITASIAQVIEAEEKLLSSLPVEVITQLSLIHIYRKYNSGGNFFI